MKIGQKVTVRKGGRNKQGTIVRHHPSLNAWVVSVKGVKPDLAYMVTEVRA